MAEEKQQEPEQEHKTRQWRLKNGTVVSRPQEWKPRPRKKLFTITDPARFGCSMLIFLITGLMILIHILSE